MSGYVVTGGLSATVTTKGRRVAASPQELARTSVKPKKKKRRKRKAGRFV